MWFRTEIELKKLVQLWDDRESAKLHFTDIRQGMHWNNRKTSDMLSKAVNEGYLEKVKQGNDWVYRNRIPDYSGYFDASEFLAKVDETCRKSGKLENFEQPLTTFTPLHILAYGTPKREELTPLEKELLFSVMQRHAHAFSDYINFCEAVRKRQEIERNKSLPDSVKSTLLAHDDHTIKTPLSIAAAHAIYGDVLWEHVFSKIVGDIRFALEKGSLDMTGPIELLHCSNSFTKLAFRLAKDIHSGKLSQYSDPDSRTTEELESLEMLDNLLEEGPKDVAIVVTPSPQTMGEYATKVGKIVIDTYDVWGVPDEITDKTIKIKGADFWSDLFERGDRKTVTRRERLRESLIDHLSSMRRAEAEPIGALDKKLMLRDKRLNAVFSRAEIQNIIESVENLIRRAHKFWILAEQGTPPSRLRKDPEWFTKEESRSYRIAQRLVAHLYLNRIKAGGPVEVGFRTHSKKMGSLVAAYQSKVRDELRKRRFVDKDKRRKS